MIVENNIKEILKEQGKNQAQLARALGVADTCINRVIMGHVSNVTVGTALKYSEALGVPVEEIFFLTNISNGGE